MNSAADALSRLNTVIEPPEEVGEMLLPEGLQIDGTPIPGGPNSLFESILKLLQMNFEGNCPSSAVI